MGVVFQPVQHHSVMFNISPTVLQTNLLYIGIGIILPLPMRPCRTQVSVHTFPKTKKEDQNKTKKQNKKRPTNKRPTKRPTFPSSLSTTKKDTKKKPSPPQKNKNKDPKTKTHRPKNKDPKKQKPQKTKKTQKTKTQKQDPLLFGVFLHCTAVLPDHMGHPQPSLSGTGVLWVSTGTHRCVDPPRQGGGTTKRQPSGCCTAAALH